MIDDGDFGAIDGMRIGSGDRSTQRKPAPVQLCLPQIPHDLTRAPTWPATVGSQSILLYLREMIRPSEPLVMKSVHKYIFKLL
jgi:hypothetical protein